MNWFEEIWCRKRAAVEIWLDRLLPGEEIPPAVIHRAMRYSVLAGGKRLRAILLETSAALLGYSDEQRLAPACALEMIHTYSLIHDDLPAMDNDDLRRGRPTCHRQFGEAMAILAGDGLLTLAFQVLARYPEDAGAGGLRAKLIGEIAGAAGSPHGMIAGQVMDISARPEFFSEQFLHDLHRLKTGALIRAALRAGALLAEADPQSLAAVTRYGESIGLAFQITDDILDVTSTPDVLGKTPGKDLQQNKLTFPALYGLERSRQLARETVESGLAALDVLPSGEERRFLKELGRYIVTRNH